MANSRSNSRSNARSNVKAWKRYTTAQCNRIVNTMAKASTSSRRGAKNAAVARLAKSMKRTPKAIAMKWSRLTNQH